MAHIPETLAALKVPIGELRPYGRNPRRGNLDVIRSSLKAHGQYRPLVVNRRTGEVLAGNHTLAAARELGWRQVAVTYVDVDDEQAARIVLVDNRASDLATYDDAALLEVLQSLPTLEATGYSEQDLGQLLDDFSEDERARDTEPSEPPAKPLARPGDLWQLGRHQLLCGDATREADVDRVADDAIEMVWTDPPYGVELADIAAARGRRHRDMAGDEHTRGAGPAAPALAHAALRTRPGGAIYLCHPETGGLAFRQALADAGYAHKQTLIWVKQQLVIGRQDYQWQHEPILYGWRPGAAHRWRGGLAETTVIDDVVDVAKLDKRQLVALVRQLQNDRGTTVIREDRPHIAALHPTVKPVALVARCVQNSSRRGDSVYDPFAGSGSTVIACENLARVCYALELDPGYCDVIVDRWQRHTGGKAKRARR